LFAIYSDAEERAFVAVSRADWKPDNLSASARRARPYF
jgi:hypothetical protein